MDTEMSSIMIDLQSKYKSTIYETLQEENKQLKMEVKELREKLQKYTNSEGHKKYYEKNKEVVKEKAKNYLEKLKTDNPDKLKEYRRRAYLHLFSFKMLN
jgi:cell division septum initiation protein DivIVA